MKAKKTVKLQVFLPQPRLLGLHQPQLLCFQKEVLGLATDFHCQWLNSHQDLILRVEAQCLACRLGRLRGKKIHFEP